MMLLTQVRKSVLPLVMFFSFLFSACITFHSVEKYETRVLEMNNELATAEDSTLTAYILPYKTKLDSKMEEVLAVSEQPMFKDKPEGTLGNFVADIILQKARELCPDSAIHFCVLNNGGLRNPLPAGNISRRNIFELMPFENEIVIVTLSGEKVNSLLEHIVNKGGMPVAGIRITIKNQMPSQVTIGESVFDISQTYRIATSDYLASGGDNMTFFTDEPRKNFLNKKIRDAIIDYLTEQNKSGKKITARKDGRIQFIQ